MSIRLDDTGFGDIMIYQDIDEFCYGVDAVILSYFASLTIKKYGKSCNVLDLGTGTGIIPLILSHKTDADNIAGIEVQKHSYELAKENIGYNRLKERIHIYNLNIKDIESLNCKGKIDVVTCNPPYFAGSCGITSNNGAKAIARHEIKGNLGDFISAAAYLLRDRGDFFLIHRPSRLVDIFAEAEKVKLQPKEMILISGKPQEKPNLVVIHFVKNGKRELKILPQMSVYDSDGSYSNMIKLMYEREKENFSGCYYME